jgi:hypothetical protein
MKWKRLSKYSDQDLLRLVRSKDEDTIVYLMCHLEKYLRKFLRQRTGDYISLANLIASITVTIIIERPSEPKLSCKLVSYATTIAKNQWTTMEKHDKFCEQKPESYFTGLASVENIYKEIETNDRQRLVNNGLQKLNDKCKFLLILFGSGFDTEEAVNELGYSSKAIYQVKKSECLKRLKSIIMKAPEFLELFDVNMEDK